MVIKYRRERQDITDVPTTGETQTALKNLENNKAPRTDNIPAELQKFGGDRLKQWLKHIQVFTSIGISEEITKECLKGIKYTLHKRGDQL